MNFSGIRLCAFMLLVIACGYLLLSTGIVLDPWSAEEPVNALTLPRLYGALLALLALALLFKHRRSRDSETFTAATDHGPHPVKSARTASVVALLAACTAALYVLPLWWVTAALIGCGMWLLGERRMHVVLPVAGGIALCGYVVIELMLGVVVRPG